MSQGNRDSSVFILILAFLITLNSCSVLGDSEIEMQEIYQIKEGACGELVLKEKLADNFDEALKKFEKEESTYYQSYCPDEPCHEIKLETYQIEVEEGAGEKLKFKAIRVLDKQKGTLLHSVSDVITSNGYHYNIVWCPEAPPVVPNE